MKETATFGRNALFIALFAAATVSTSVVTVVSGIPNQLHMLLLAPILMAALLRQRYVYLTMLAILVVCVSIVTDNYKWPITDSTVTVIATTLTTVIACETIRFAVRKQKRLWRRIAESEQRLRAVIDNARDTVFTIDEAGTIVDVNASVANVLGYSPEELLDTGFDELIDAKATPAFRLDDESNWNGDLIRKDGIRLPVEISIGHARHGRGMVHIAILRDQSDCNRAEAQIRHAEAIRQSILESTPDHIIMVDLDYRILFINRTVPDRTVESVLGQDILSMVPSETRDSVRSTYDRVRETKQPAAFETEYISTEDESVSYFESRIAPVIEGGEVAGFIVTATDVTERRRQENERQSLERRALQSQKLESLGLLAGGVAHDFNNLLVGIMGQADLARDDVNDAEKTEAHLQQIAEASVHAAGLCKQLLAYSGKGKFAVAPMAIADLVVEARKLLDISVPENIRLAFDLDAQRTVVEADNTQIKQVLMNLVRNASDAMQPNGGTIWVRTGTQTLSESSKLTHINGDEVEAGEFAYLEVSDKGNGMTSATMERLFDPFYTTKADGTGLGMAAVLGIVRGHNGAMSIASSEGGGTTIRVLLPTSSKPARTPMPEVPADEHSRDRGGLILVVDDEPVVRNVAQRVLERAAFEVIAVDSGCAAIEAVETRGSEIAAILLDMKMPDMNGEQVMERVRALRPGLPILLSSGYSETEVMQRSRGKGVSAVLPKPYRAQELVDAVNAILLAVPSELKDARQTKPNRHPKIERYF